MAPKLTIVFAYGSYCVCAVGYGEDCVLARSRDPQEAHALRECILTWWEEEQPEGTWEDWLPEWEAAQWGT